MYNWAPMVYHTESQGAVREQGFGRALPGAQVSHYHLGSILTLCEAGGGAQGGVSSQGGQSSSSLPSSPSVGWNDWQPVPKEVSWLEAEKQKTFPG